MAKEQKERKNTRNANGTGCIRQRSDGKWEGQITLGKDHGTGKQRRKSVYGKTQKEVKDKIRDILKEVDEGTYVEPTKMTVRTWLDVWVRDYLLDKAPHTRKGYVSACENRIKPQLGAVRLSALTLPDIQKFINEQSEPLPALGLNALAPKSVKNIHGILSKALSQAVACGYIKVNPATGCKLPRWVRPEIQPLNNEQIAEFFGKIKGHKHETLLILAVMTGMREGELVGLTWDSVKQDTLYINKQLQLIDGGYVEGLPKWNKKRTITPATVVMALLREHKQKQEQQAELAGQAWCNQKGYVFTDELGRHLAIPTVYKNFKRIVEKMGLPEIRFHDLRHTYAVTALQAGDDIKAVSENMGHHSTAFTLDTYGHFTKQMKEKSAAIMDKVFKEVTNTD
jgi:integrase